MNNLWNNGLNNTFSPHDLYVLALNRDFQNGERNYQQVQKLMTKKFEIDLERDKAMTSAVMDITVEGSEGRYMLIGCYNGDLEVADYFEGGETISLKKRAHKYGISHLEWYPFDNGLFLSASYDSTVQMWDTNRMESVWTIHQKGKVHDVAISSCASSHTLIASASDDIWIRLSDLRMRTNIIHLEGHLAHPSCVQFSPTNEYILSSGGSDGAIMIWDIRKGKKALTMLSQYHTRYNPPEPMNLRSDKIEDSYVLAHSGFVTNLQYSHDGKYLYSAGLDTSGIRKWDVMKGYENTLTAFEQVYHRQGKKSRFAISTNDSYLYFPRLDSVVCYDSNGKLCYEIGNHFEKVNCVCYNPILEEFYSGGSDFKIYSYVSVLLQDERLTTDQDNWSDSSWDST